MWIWALLCLWQGKQGGRVGSGLPPAMLCRVSGSSSDFRDAFFPVPSPARVSGSPRVSSEGRGGRTAVRFASEHPTNASPSSNYDWEPGPHHITVKPSSTQTLSLQLDESWRRWREEEVGSNEEVLGRCSLTNRVPVQAVPGVCLSRCGPCPGVLTGGEHAIWAGPEWL